MNPYSADWYWYTSFSRSQYPNSSTEPFLKIHDFLLAAYSQTLLGNLARERWISERSSSENVLLSKRPRFPGASNIWIKPSHRSASDFPPPTAPPYRAMSAGQE